MNYKIKSLVYLVCFVAFALAYYVMDNEKSNDRMEIVQVDRTISAQDVN